MKAFTYWNNNLKIKQKVEAKIKSRIAQQKKICTRVTTLAVANWLEPVKIVATKKNFDQLKCCFETHKKLTEFGFLEEEKT